MSRQAGMARRTVCAANLVHGAVVVVFLYARYRYLVRIYSVPYGTERYWAYRVTKTAALCTVNYALHGGNIAYSIFRFLWYTGFGDKT